MTEEEFKFEFACAIAESHLDISVQDASPKLCAAKEDALKTISSRCQAYHKHGYDHALVLAVLTKKLALLKSAVTVTTVRKISEPCAPVYNGNGSFTTDEAWVAEEELIQWSLASLRAPLSSDGYNRFFALTEQFFGKVP